MITYYEAGLFLKEALFYFNSSLKNYIVTRFFILFLSAHRPPIYGIENGIVPPPKLADNLVTISL
jgi:hypothetical protein